MEKIYFRAENGADHLYGLWASGFFETPKEAADDFIKSIKDENHPNKMGRLKALNNGCGRGILEITSRFKKPDGSYTLSNFGPIYRIGIIIVELGKGLPGPGTKHEMINSENLWETL